MGYAISWCTVREDQADAFVAELGLTSTGKREEVPESPICMMRLDTGWRLIWFNDYNPRQLQDARLPALSTGRDLVVCRIEEHVMAASAEYWSGGKRTWWISHEGDDGPRGLDVEGKPPEFFAGIRAELEERQRGAGGDDADVDLIFEIPPLVAREIVGFKHDLVSAYPAGRSFDVMQATRAGFFGRLFGA